jgi:hypothetical protein
MGSDNRTKQGATIGEVLSAAGCTVSLTKLSGKPHGRDEIRVEVKGGDITDELVETVEAVFEQTSYTVAQVDNQCIILREESEFRTESDNMGGVAKPTPTTSQPQCMGDLNPDAPLPAKPAPDLLTSTDKQQTPAGYIQAVEADITHQYIALTHLTEIVDAADTVDDLYNTELAGAYDYIMDDSLTSELLCVYMSIFGQDGDADSDTHTNDDTDRSADQIVDVVGVAYADEEAAYPAADWCIYIPTSPELTFETFTSNLTSIKSQYDEHLERMHRMLSRITE